MLPIISYLTPPNNLRLVTCCNFELMYRHDPVNSVPAILLITGKRVDADSDADDVSVLTNDDDAAVAFSLSATSSWDR